MKGLIVATQFLTRLPTPRIMVSEAAFARSMRWFPAVGLILGLLIATAARLGCMIDSWTGALLALLAWVMLTGALHLDGLGDMADAAGATHKGRDEAPLRAILADPHVGSFAVVAIVLQLLAKLVLLHALLDRSLLLPLILIPFAARIAPLVWTRTLPPLHEGLASRFRHSVRTLDLLIWGVCLIAAASFMPALLAMPLLLLLWGLWLGRHIGGISGDGHGAGIELMESGLLLASLSWAVLT